MNQAVYDRLIAVAKNRALISYSDLSRLADLDVGHLPDMDKLVKILEEIAEHETKANRPLLVIVVIRENIGMPAKGLFKWAKQHKVQTGKDDVAFFGQELQRVYAAWPDR